MVLRLPLQAAHTVPMVLFLLFGGVVADRLPRTLVLQVSNLASGTTQAAVAALLITGRAELWMIIVLEAVHGLVSAMSMPAMAGMVPQLVRREELQRANALLSMSRGVLTIAGPTTGALLVVTVGSGWALAVDAAAWFVAALLLLPVRIPPRAPRRREQRRDRRAAGGLGPVPHHHLVVGRRPRLRIPQRDPRGRLVHARPGRG